MNSRALFGTDGVRGVAGKYPLDRAGAGKIGQAVGAHFAKPGQQVVIGCDTRESSAGLVSALTIGLTSVGVNVTSVGVIPTPGLAYLTRQGSDFVAGLMVTASHNPYEYNGIKVFDGHGDKLPDATEEALNGLIEKGVETWGVTGGSKTDYGLAGRYEDFLVNSVDNLNLSGQKMAIDCANGAASGLAQRVFNRLDAQVTSLFDQPDGRNINAGCGATNTTVLKQAVIDGQLDLGLALDGDGDRLALIDGQGRELTGDHMLYLLAVDRHLNGVVATVMTNLGVEQALDRHNTKLERVQVGDRYVLESLKRTGFELGGEQSGHIIFPKLLATGDGLLTAVQILKTIHDTGKPLAEWRDEVRLLPQALVNVSMPDKTSLDRNDVKAFIKHQADQLKGQGRLLIRPSGTEPLVRVMVEAPDAQLIAERIARELEDLLAA